MVNNYLLGKRPAGLRRPLLEPGRGPPRRRPAPRLRASGARQLVDAHPAAWRCWVDPVDLQQVDIDSYIVAGLKDHIVPWENAYNGAQLLGGGKRFVLSTSGHIQALVNPPAPDAAPPTRWSANTPPRPGLPRAGGEAARQLVARLRPVAGGALGRTEGRTQGAWQLRLQGPGEGARDICARQLKGFSGSERKCSSTSPRISGCPKARGPDANRRVTTPAMRSEVADDDFVGYAVHAVQPRHVVVGGVALVLLADLALQRHPLLPDRDVDRVGYVGVPDH